MFLCAQRSRLEIEQFLPIGLASEQIAIPPNGAGFERDAFGVAQPRQNFRENRHHKARDQMTTQRRRAEQCCKYSQHGHRRLEQLWRRDTDDTPTHQPDAGSRHPAEKAEATKRERQKNNAGKYNDDPHGASLFRIA